MRPELFHIGGITLYSYGFFILLGMVAAFLHLYFNRVRLGMDVDSISELILWCGLGVFVGGKLFFFFEDPVGYWNNMGHFLTHLGDGFVFYGSFLVTLPILYWWFKQRGWDFWDRMDDVGCSWGLGSCYRKNRLSDGRMLSWFGLQARRLGDCF